MDSNTAIDYGNSWMFFRDGGSLEDPGANHTPRAIIESSCTITAPGSSEEGKRFFVGCSCATEAMYVETGLIHDPMAEFRFIFAPNDEYVMVKWHADGAFDVRAPHKMGESMPRHGGGRTGLDAFWPRLRYHKEQRQISTYAEIRAAHMCEVPWTGQINARTEFTMQDGTRICLDYPVKTSNIANSEEQWQMDCGPLLMPRPVPASGQRMDILGDCLSLGYLVYNRLDYAEAIVRAPTTIGGGTATVNFFSQRAALDCKTTLFAVVDATAAKL